MRPTRQVSIHRLDDGDVESLDDVVAVEQAVSIAVSGVRRIKAVCSPDGLGEWVLGYLASEGLIRSPEDVVHIAHEGTDYRVRLRHEAEVPAPLRVRSDFNLGASRIRDVVSETASRASCFRETGGTHVMAIADGTGIRTLVEDISRTCALEKAIGEALIAGVDFGQSFSVLSSRVPSRMVRKLARCGIPIVAAVSAPTAEAVDLAEELGICLCGFVRCDRMNVYSHGWRIGL